MIQRTAPNGDGTFTVTVFQPGIGVEQAVVLIGMDLLSQYDFRYEKNGKELVIEY